ncbi:hypothetical protein LJC59_07765 [Desulfovibrio sp. OttesenSCG-928-A18]|nr:hypothetical protein [Desulfovibrio sp. OttesenSCG-928-A18]
MNKAFTTHRAAATPARADAPSGPGGRRACRQIGRLNALAALALALVLVITAAGLPASQVAAADKETAPGTAKAAAPGTREAYAALLREKLQFSAKVMNDFEKSGWYQDAGQDTQYRARKAEQYAQLLWKLRDNPGAVQRIMAVATDSADSVENRAGKLDKALALLESMYKQNSYALLGPAAQRQGYANDQDEFGPLLVADQQQRRLYAFLFDLYDAFGTDFFADDNWHAPNLPMNDEQRKRLFDSKPGPELFEALKRAYADRPDRYQLLNDDELAALLRDPKDFSSQFAARQKIEKVKEMLRQQTGSLPLDQILPEAGEVVTAPGMHQFRLQRRPDGSAFTPTATSTPPMAEVPLLPQGGLPNGLHIRRVSPAMPPVLNELLLNLRKRGELKYFQRLLADRTLSPKEMQVLESIFAAPGAAFVELAQGEALYGLKLDELALYNLESEPRPQNWLPIWRGSPLDSLSPVGAYLTPWDLASAPYWNQVAIEGNALLLASRAQAHDIAAHVASLSIMSIEDNERPGHYALCVYASNTHRLLWMLLLGSEEDVDRIFGPVDAFWLYYPFSTGEAGDWVELRRVGGSGKARRLGQDPIISLPADLDLHVLKPMGKALDKAMAMESSVNLMLRMQRERGADLPKRLQTPTQKDLRQLARKYSDLCLELGYTDPLELRDAILMLLATDSTPENLATARAMLADEAAGDKRQRLSKLERWAMQVLQNEMQAKP